MLPRWPGARPQQASEAQGGAAPHGGAARSVHAMVRRPRTAAWPSSWRRSWHGPCCASVVERAPCPSSEARLSSLLAAAVQDGTFEDLQVVTGSMSCLIFI